MRGTKNLASNPQTGEAQFLGLTELHVEPHFVEPSTSRGVISDGRSQGEVRETGSRPARRQGFHTRSGQSLSIARESLSATAMPERELTGEAVPRKGSTVSRPSKRKAGARSQRSPRGAGGFSVPLLAAPFCRIFH